MRFSYVLPEPGSYRRWEDFESDLACLKRTGYDAVELQIADVSALDEARLRRSLDAAGCPLCAFQTGGTYATRGNCLSTAKLKNTIDLGNISGNQRWGRNSAVLTGRRDHNDILNTGHSGWYGHHQNGRRVGSTAARHIQANPPQGQNLLPQAPVERN